MSFVLELNQRLEARCVRAVKGQVPLRVAEHRGRARSPRGPLRVREHRGRTRPPRGYREQGASGIVGVHLNF